MGLRTAAIGFGLAAVGAGLVPAATAEAATAGSNCVVQVVGQEESGEYVLGEPECFATFEEAMAEAGVDTSGLSEVSVDTVSRAALLGSTSVVHYDGANKSGASLTVTGAACSGGYVNLSALWVNRISSTKNGCGTVRHYDGANLTGNSEITTLASWNLTYMSNAADSVQYLA